MADKETRRPGSNGSTASMSKSEARRNAHPESDARAAGPFGHSDSATSPWISTSEDGHSSDLQAHPQIDTSPSGPRAHSEQHNSTSTGSNTAPAATMDASEPNAPPQQPPQAESGALAVSGAPIDTGTENHIHAAQTGDETDFVEVQLDHGLQQQQQQLSQRSESPAPPEQGTRCPLLDIELPALIS
jgi:hypothetical protein